MRQLFVFLVRPCHCSAAGLLLLLLPPGRRVPRLVVYLPLASAFQVTVITGSMQHADSSQPTVQRGSQRGPWQEGEKHQRGTGQRRTGKPGGLGHRLGKLWPHVAARHTALCSTPAVPRGQGYSRCTVGHRYPSSVGPPRIRFQPRFATPTERVPLAGKWGPLYGEGAGTRHLPWGTRGVGYPGSTPPALARYP